MVMTKQRQMIMEYFQEHPETHPNAEEIYDYVKEKVSTIGIATVYRNLKKLVEANMIRELNLEKQGVRYDFVIQEHFHFVCDHCGAIENFVIPELLQIDDIVEQHIHGYVKRKDFIFHGTCKDCLSKR